MEVRLVNRGSIAGAAYFSKRQGINWYMLEPTIVGNPGQPNFWALRVDRTIRKVGSKRQIQFWDVNLI